MSSRQGRGGGWENYVDLFSCLRPSCVIVGGPYFYWLSCSTRATRSVCYMLLLTWSASTRHAQHQVMPHVGVYSVVAVSPSLVKYCIN